MTVRPSSSIADVAATLGVSEDHVRRLIEAGEIEAWRVGVRKLAVYLDSVGAYQQRQSLSVVRMRPRAKAIIKERQAVTGAAHEAAMARLRAAGVVR